MKFAPTSVTVVPGVAVDGLKPVTVGGLIDELVTVNE
jgi:hypothetical protein